MATPITATINTTTKEATISGTSSLRETIALTVVNIGNSSAAALTAAIFDGDNARMAEGLSFADSGANAVGEINLNTEELIAAFALSNNRDKKTFTLVIIDGATEDVLCNTKIKIIYTPDAGVTPVPVTGDGVAYTSGEKTKLAGIAEGATTNSADATLLARANHTGTQTAATISDFDAEVSNNTDVAANTLVKHGHSNFSLLETLTQTEANLADAVTKKHAHTNSALLGTLTQTEANLADAVTKKHGHTNLTTIEKISEDEISGALLFDGNSVVGQGDVRSPGGVVSGNFAGFADATGQLLADSGTKPADFQLVSEKGAANGYAELDSSGKVPSAQLPAYVDDILEYADAASLPATGATGIIYVTLDDNKAYRWSGSAYVEISASLALGETSGTAYRGDRGKTAYDHSQLTSGNPHSVSKSDIGLGNITNILNKLDGTAAPTTGDDSVDGYSIGSRWLDVTNSKEYVCKDATEGAAVWIEVTAPGTGGYDGNITTLDIDGGTDIGAALVDADLMIVDDGASGTNRKSTLSRLWTYMLGKMTIDSAICQGRLTLESGVPVSTTNQTAKTTLYFTPYLGNLIGIYSGTAWSVGAFTEKSLSLSGLTASTNYDIFIYDNSGTLTLEALAWTDATTRATALTTQDGIYVKSGDATRRYLGTIRTTASAGQCEDSVTSRFVWNCYNKTERRLVKSSSSAHTYNSATLRYWNNDSTQYVGMVSGELVPLVISIALVGKDVSQLWVGVDGSTTTINYIANNYTDYITCSMTMSTTNTGYHTYTVLERSGNGGTATFNNYEMNFTINN